MTLKSGNPAGPWIDRSDTFITPTKAIKTTHPQPTCRQARHRDADTYDLTFEKKKPDGRFLVGDIPDGRTFYLADTSSFGEFCSNGAFYHAERDERGERRLEEEVVTAWLRS